MVAGFISRSSESPVALQQVMNRFAEAIEAARVDVVPRMVVSGGSGSGASGGNLMEGLLAMLLSERMGVQVNGTGNEPARPEVEALRNQIRQGIAGNRSPEPNGASAAQATPTTPLVPPKS